MLLPCSLNPQPQPTEDPAILCSLAFSDYELWSNPAFRDPNRDGFVPLRTVLHTSSVFLAAAHAAAAAAVLTEAAIVKSLRVHARDTFDIRMIVVDKARSRRGRHGHALAGGYELRRKDWAEVTQRFPSFSAEYWDARTIYIENIPLSFRSMVGVSKLLHGLLPRNQKPSSRDYNHLQSIFFPPHHQDPPDAQPNCKGFALVTLSEQSATSHLRARFPFHKRAHKRNASPTDDDDDDGNHVSPEELEALKAGFRTLSKQRWEALQTEYVAYRDSLLHHMATSTSITSTAGKLKVRHTLANHEPPREAGNAQEEEATATATARRPNFPRGCVIFARHIPQGTNKTALRSLFSAFLAEGDGDGHAVTVATAEPAALDYVDYTKGLDSCYLRLKTREYASLLLERFGKKMGAGEKIALELLDGRGEEMYWECVPDKVRALAVQRAEMHKAPQRDGNVAQADDEDGSMGLSGERKRRRRRR